MEEIKINYFKNWGNDGTCYNQTITIPLDIAIKFNKYIKNIKNSLNKKQKIIFTSEDLKILYYLKNLEKRN